MLNSFTIGPLTVALSRSVSHQINTSSAFIFFLSTEWSTLAYHPDLGQDFVFPGVWTADARHWPTQLIYFFRSLYCRNFLRSCWKTTLCALQQTIQLTRSFFGRSINDYPRRSECYPRIHRSSSTALDTNLQCCIMFRYRPSWWIRTRCAEHDCLQLVSM
jgi:hypothetical protein